MMMRRGMVYCIALYLALAVLYMLPPATDAVRLGHLSGRVVLVMVYGLLAIAAVLSEASVPGFKAFDTTVRRPLAIFQAAVILVIWLRTGRGNVRLWPLLALSAASIAILALSHATSGTFVGSQRTTTRLWHTRVRVSILLLLPILIGSAVVSRPVAPPSARSGLGIPDSQLSTFQGQQRLKAWMQQQRRITSINSALEKNTVANPAIVVLEFTDYQCPACREAHLQFHPVIRALALQLGDRLVYQRLDYPLNSDCNRFVPTRLHSGACGAALAAKAAASVGKLQPFEDWAFSHQSELGEPQMAAILQTLGVHELLMSARPQFEDALRRDVEFGGRIGIVGTPTFFVNGLDISGLTPRAFEAVVLAEAAPLASESDPRKETLIDAKDRAPVNTNAAPMAAPGSTAALLNECLDEKGHRYTLGARLRIAGQNQRCVTGGRWEPNK